MGVGLASEPLLARQRLGENSGDGEAGRARFADGPSQLNRDNCALEALGYNSREQR